MWLNISSSTANFMKKLNLLFTTFTILLLVGCKEKLQEKEVTQYAIKKGDIVNTIINDEDDYYHINFSSYPSNDKTLPIGVFDSGTGGLTVLKAIVNYDQNQNESLEKGSDGVLDFNHFLG